MSPWKGICNCWPYRIFREPLSEAEKSRQMALVGKTAPEIKGKRIRPKKK